jgi:hypothetical protein
MLAQLVAPGQEFELPFGPDNNIKVERKILSEKNTVTSDKTKSGGTVTIKLRNWSKVARTVDLEEPMPMSKDSRIKVAMGEIVPKPTETDSEGKSKWSLNLPAGDSTTVSIPYRIEYASGLNISGR